MRVGFGYDSHRLVSGRRLILGGVEIPHGKGLLGHSDADVLVHAVCDAVVGAMAGGDIGRLFPDTDPAYRGISSLKLLSRVRALAEDKGFRVRNVDSTIVLEEPKLQGHIAGMVNHIADALGIAAGCVSIKAKTNEGMGFVGRGEGIAAFAVALLDER
ncbi:MAG: 2-C-methyl-D-erythritol 2,4-cyclodiphosphate synthase [Syntrophaceae bacterium PtaU1.Bin231]|nr:MAG: 2-C-methyl-D-erythritol 2,4-cyclodiphosphate synthase [Syntrophaceae bacterium PtaU1.Bin231]